MHIETVAILGAGAIGSYLIDGLADKLGSDLWVVAEGQRAERLAREGVVVNGRRIGLNVRTAEQARGADALFVNVKYGALRGLLEQIATVAGEDAVVVSTLNGVDSESIIEQRIGQGRALPSLMKLSVRRIGSESVYDPAVAQGLFIGEPDGRPSERTAAVQELFAGSAVRCHVSDDILREQWQKFALNVSRNLPQAILNCGFGAYSASAHVERMGAALREEVVAVAAARGIDISGPSAVGTNSPLPPDARFSTLQDLDAGRPTEIDMFSGTVVSMGVQLGVPTPVNEFVYHAVKALEEKNAGVFS